MPGFLATVVTDQLFVGMKRPRGSERIFHYFLGIDLGREGAKRARR
jgi:hypothetical protein